LIFIYEDVVVDVYDCVVDVELGCVVLLGVICFGIGFFGDFEV